MAALYKIHGHHSMFETAQPDAAGEVQSCPIQRTELFIEVAGNQVHGVLLLQALQRARDVREDKKIGKWMDGHSKQ